MLQDMTSSDSVKYYDSQFGGSEHFPVLHCFVKSLIFFLPKSTKTELLVNSENRL